MTAATQRISEQNLHERLAAAGPADELKRLGDTIDNSESRMPGASAGCGLLARPRRGLPGICFLAVFAQN